MKDEQLDPLPIRREVHNLMLLMTPRELTELLDKAREITERKGKRKGDA